MNRKNIFAAGNHSGKARRIGPGHEKIQLRHEEKNGTDAPFFSVPALPLPWAGAAALFHFADKDQVRVDVDPYTAAQQRAQQQRQRERFAQQGGEHGDE